MWPLPFEDESLAVLGVVIGLANLALLLTLMISLALRGRNDRLLRRATRKVLILTREKTTLKSVLNNVIEQYRAARRTLAPTPAPESAPRPVFIVPPPLPLEPIEGDDGVSWLEDGHATQALDGVDRRTRRLDTNPALIRATKTDTGEPVSGERVSGERPALVAPKKSTK